MPATTAGPGGTAGPDGTAGPATSAGPDAPEVSMFGAAVRFTGCAHGDMADPSGIDPEVTRRRRAVVDRPWTVLRQVHGCEVIVVDRPGGQCGRAGDASVGQGSGMALAVLTADCAPVAFASPEGVIGVAHAGWRGLLTGVVEETVAAMRALGATTVHAALGPCIHAECYAFGPGDLDRAAACLGEAVRGRTSDGWPALDIVAAVRGALARAGAEPVFDSGVCTSCSPAHWSWRARRDPARQATVVWQL